MSRVSTIYLLTCAAIGVAGGVLFWSAAWVSSLLFATTQFYSVALAGLWLTPAVIGLRLLERPLAGLLVGLMAGLVAFAYLGTSLWWSFFAELPFLVVLYRHWRTWQYYAGAVVVAVVYPVLSAAYFNLWTIPLAAQIGFFALTLVSCLAGVALGILIADRLRHAGVARLARRAPGPRDTAPEER
ncbi:hypothetical protein GCM10009808_23480 [Microbacterium sediminicola]|uniref:Energy-coupling factor transport system substrate-specific component n=1 Tax=Microbacterium sediminicola TaxID=415210 RepID=A0ABN2IH23_9MICO